MTSRSKTLGGKPVRGSKTTESVPPAAAPAPASAGLQAAAAPNDYTSERKQAEKRIAQLNRAQAILTGIDRAIVRTADRQKLLDEVCRIAVEMGGFKLAWVGMTAADGSVQPVAQAGATGYLEGIRVTTHNGPEGRGPIGTAIRLKRPVVIEEADGDPCMAPWHGRLRKFGLRYAAVFPIQVSGKVTGSFQVYAPKAHFFDEQELGLLTQMTGDVSFALTAIEDLTARKEAEAALRDANELNQQMLASAKEGILVYDCDLKCLIWNPAIEKLTEMSASQVIGKRLFEVFPFLQQTEIKERIERNLAGQPCPEAEIQLHPPHLGRTVWISDTLSAIRNARGEIIGGMSIVRDITERKQAEERIVTLNRVQTIMADIDRAIVHINDRQKLLDEICRVAVDEGGFKLAWVGMVAPNGTVLPVARAGEAGYLDGVRVVIHDEPEGRGAVGRAIREGRAIVAEEADQDPLMAPWHNRLRKFGLRYMAAFPIRISGKIVGSFQVYAPHANFFDENEISLLTQVSNDISFALTAISDLAARKQAEDAMRRSEHNLASFFNQAPVGLVWLSSNGTILRTNEAQLGLQRCTAREYLGHSFAEFCLDASQSAELLERLAAKKMVRNFRLELRSADGATHHMLLDAVSFLADAASFRKDNPFRFSAVFLRDISDLVQLELDVSQSTERESRRIAQDLHDGLGQLLAGTAHMASALQKKIAAKSRPEARQLDRILKAIKEAIAQARDISRGLHPVESESNGLMVALESLARRTQSLYHVRCRFCCPEPVLMEDNAAATHLYRIAQEAVGNAVKHGKPGRIDISLTATPERIHLAVKDNGAGMPARQTGKTGMGLRIMRHRAGLIKGTLAIQNEPRGGASVICTMALPAAGVSKPAAPGRSKRELI